MTGLNEYFILTRLILLKKLLKLITSKVYIFLMENQLYVNIIILTTEFELG